MISESVTGTGSTRRVIMFHRFRIPSFLAAVFATLVLAPAAFADGGITPDNRADRIGPAGTVVQIR
ncbi:MAG TPA: hypothetical protein VE777_07920 [Gaiellales bacterium]|nr:hypothetical protein [Gaiellales bacterium]